jgi:hypothetical protein
MELLNMYLTAAYFQFEYKFNQEDEEIAMRNSLSPVVSNMFMEQFEEIALDTADHKPAKCLRYVDATSMIWPHGTARLQ